MSKEKLTILLSILILLSSINLMHFMKINAQSQSYSDHLYIKCGVCVVVAYRFYGAQFWYICIFERDYQEFLNKSRSNWRAQTCDQFTQAKVINCPVSCCIDVQIVMMVQTRHPLQHHLINLVRNVLILQLSLHLEIKIKFKLHSVKLY